MNTFKISFFSLFIFFMTNYGFTQINEAIKFKITDSNGNTDELIIRLSNESTNQFDPLWDAWKLFTPDDLVPSLYSETSESEPLAINAIPLMSKDTIINLQMRARLVGGLYTMETEQLGYFPDEVKIAIKDMVSGNIYELNQDQIFTFNVNVNPNDDFSRFEVFYSPVSKIDIFENDLSITNSGGINWDYSIIDVQQLIVESGNSNTDEITVFDLPVGDYNLIVTDSYFLTDTIDFTIAYEDEIIEVDTVNYENEVGDEITMNINENPLTTSNLIKTTNGYMIDLSNSEFSGEMIVKTYTMTGAILNEINVFSFENVYLNFPNTNTYYIVVLHYEDEFLSYKVMDY